MDPGFLVTGVLRSLMGARGKKSGRALRYLTGGHGSFLSSPATLLTAAGVAWGVYETLQGGHGPGRSDRSSGSPEPVPPPLPDIAGAGDPVVGDEALRVVRLAVSAAHADGAMNERERAAVLERATEAGLAEIVEQELQRRMPLAEIVAGVGDRAERATLYVLAFTILRADEQVTGAERIYLAQLAHLLDLDAALVQRLEQEAGERIEAQGDQGQPAG
jgi:uncharacterized membrane protein YebE (DUF533 family)